MPYKFNPFTGTFDDSTPGATGAQGPAGVAAAANSGTELLPGITFATDLNTGVFNPSADNFAISTGGSEKLRATSAGFVGIGTSSPECRLHVVSPSSANGEIIQRWGYTAGSQNLYNLTLKTAVSPGIVRYSFSMLNSGTSYNDVLVLDTGNVGIGTASPSSLLHLADAGDITVGTTTGTKIGTATTQKLGFYNATPVVQPTAVANATTAVDVITQLNDLLAKLRTLGIIAT